MLLNDSDLRRYTFHWHPIDVAKLNLLWVYAVQARKCTPGGTSEPLIQKKKRNKQTNIHFCCAHKPVERQDSSFDPLFRHCLRKTTTRWHECGTTREDSSQATIEKYISPSSSSSSSRPSSSTHNPTFDCQYPPPAMFNTAVTTTTARTTLATHTPTTCGSYAPGANCRSRAQDGETSAISESRVLFLCLRNIAAFVWAASRSALQRMLPAYLQSVLVSPTWRSLPAAVPRRILPVVSRGVALRTRDIDTVPHRAPANPNGKKKSCSYLGGTYDSQLLKMTVQVAR